MYEEPCVASGGVKETRSRGGSPSSSGSHQKFTAPCNGRGCTITGAFCYPYLVACTRNQTEGEDDVEGAGEERSRRRARKREGETGGARWEAIAPGHSFCVRGGKLLCVPPTCTVAMAKHGASRDDRNSLLAIPIESGVTPGESGETSRSQRVMTTRPKERLS